MERMSKELRVREPMVRECVSKEPRVRERVSKEPRVRRRVSKEPRVRGRVSKESLRVNLFLETDVCLSSCVPCLLTLSSLVVSVERGEGRAQIWLRVEVSEEEWDKEKGRFSNERTPIVIRSVCDSRWLLTIPRTTHLCWSVVRCMMTVCRIGFP